MPAKFKNLGGRPRHHEEAKRCPLNMRTTPQLREKMAAAAAANGRSLSSEVEFRLERSFLIDEMRLAIREEWAFFGSGLNNYREMAVPQALIDPKEWQNR